LKVVIIGSGYVGLTTATLLAYLGNNVSLIDIDKEKIRKLKEGNLPYFEYGMGELLRQVSHKIDFINSWENLDLNSDVVFIAVGTPMDRDGSVDLSQLQDSIDSLSKKMNETNNPLIVLKSTVPPGTSLKVKEQLEDKLRAKGITIEAMIASNPEFLREGRALYDFLYPDRIVIGAETTNILNKLTELYRPILEQSFATPSFFNIKKRPPELVETDTNSAELIKYAANSFLAMKISFINEFANLAEKVGADISDVARGIGLDRRIGPDFLQAGVGWGGSCFPKDTSAILNTAKQIGLDMDLIKATITVNEKQKEMIINKLQLQLGDLKGKVIGILGLAFKPGTDDLRNASSFYVIEKLIKLGVYIKAFDPAAMEKAKRSFNNLKIEYTNSSEEVFIDSHAVVLITDWEEFKRIPLITVGNYMKNKLIIDGRNVFDQDEVYKAGITYIGIGRGNN